VYKIYGGLIAAQKPEPAGFAVPLGLKDVRLVLAAGCQRRSVAASRPGPRSFARRDCPGTGEARLGFARASLRQECWSGELRAYGQAGQPVLRAHSIGCGSIGQAVEPVSSLAPPADGFGGELSLLLNLRRHVVLWFEETLDLG